MSPKLKSNCPAGHQGSYSPKSCAKTGLCLVCKLAIVTLVALRQWTSSSSLCTLKSRLATLANQRNSLLLFSHARELPSTDTSLWKLSGRLSESTEGQCEVSHLLTAGFLMFSCGQSGLAAFLRSNQPEETCGSTQ